MSSRQRPLHACGVSIFAIGDITIRKTQHINGPIGSTLRNIAKFVTPLIYVIQYQWLTILSFIDDRILSLENIAEKLFPPSSYAFDKLDEIVLMILSLPDKFDGALNKYVPAIVHKVPLLEWTLTHLISKLNSLDSNWEHENSRVVVNEKTIGVDSNCKNSNKNEEVESTASEVYLNLPMESEEIFPPIPEAENKGVVVAVSSCATNLKGSYKEALLESSSEKKIDSIDECEEGKEKHEECESDEKLKVGRSEGMKYDPLLELFESAWLMNPGRFWNQGQTD